jgi:hypothetical protein
LALRMLYILMDSVTFATPLPFICFCHFLVKSRVARCGREKAPFLFFV